MSNPAFTVRVVSAGDSRALELLARLTGRSWPLAGRTLLAERDGVPLAAIRLTSGMVLADPSNEPPDLVSALRFTRYRIMRQGGQTGAARSLLSLARGLTVSA
ncbi:MAG: hypothetical protein JO243_18830 [Solirubrobacterales bacterium]|nr:hypothetical protein [Solirubrobacterales bacterium]